MTKTNRGQVRGDFQKIYKSQYNINSLLDNLDNFLNSDEDSLPMTHLKCRRLPHHQASQLECEISEEELKQCLFMTCYLMGVSSYGARACCLMGHIVYRAYCLWGM